MKIIILLFIFLFVIIGTLYTEGPKYKTLKPINFSKIEQFSVNSIESVMTQEIAFQLIKESEIIKSCYNDKYYNLIDVKKYECIIYPNCWIAIFFRKGDYDYLCFEVCEIKDNEVGKHFSLLPRRIDNKNEVLDELLVDLTYNNSIFLKQVSSFRVPNTDLFQYDFNHDGVDEFLSIDSDYEKNIVLMECPKFPDFKFGWILEFNYGRFSEKKFKIEFINYKKRQGIKMYAISDPDADEQINEWQFYYYDRIRQKYVQDETASSEELEQIYGSPDFFAEAGIDYTKLERPLLPSELEGFSKPALRIWRNAIYARHGRTFKSEDLQALFNEYAWYKPDENYSDEKLTDIDIQNIKLIQQFENK